MAGPFQPHDPEGQNHSSPGSGNTPSSQSGTPISFRKNVNRAKTKRWVEARQYSYDGDDWGEDEYNEYDSNPPPVPQPLSSTQANGGASELPSNRSSRPSLLSAGRSQSANQPAAVDSDGSRGDRSRSADRNDGKTSHGPPDSKVLPFIRPADIYKRMQQGGAGRGQAQSLGRSDEVSQEVGQPASSASPLPRHGGMFAGDDRALHQSLGPVLGGKPGSEMKSRSPDSKPTSNPAIGLPEVKGLSSFSTDVFGQPTSSASDTTSTAHPPPLQHNNSFGLQSAVHQAFNAPETPDSAVDSVSRSNSESTSAISPIISRRTMSDQITPTIVEEPSESETAAVDTPGDIPFKPGHRRDVSLSGSDSSPSRKPDISEGEQHPMSASAELSSTDLPQDYFQLYRPTADPSGSSRQSSSHEGEVPAPLRPASIAAVGQSDLKDSIPVIVPSISSDDSPVDTENDRLRKEIIRSLSRENSPSDGAEEFRPETDHGSGFNSNQRERCGNDEDGHDTCEPPRPEAQAHALGPPDTFDEILSGGPHPAAAPAMEQPKPRLTRRFSWESSSSEELPPAGGFQPAPSQTAPFHGEPSRASDGGDQLGSESMADDPEHVSGRNVSDDRSSVEKPKFSVIAPSSADGGSLSDQHLPEVLDDQAVQSVPPSDDSDLVVQAVVPVSAPPSSSEPSLPGFRDILQIKSSSERVRSFDRTRDQFAAVDTGLNHWIRVTINARPEHMDIVEQSLKLTDNAPKPSVSKGKFPKLPSLGNLAPSVQPGPLHVRRPSAHMMNRQQVEQRGKDLLHSAGVLGGRAGGAAKGLFAKGKNKLNLGGADKGTESSRKSVHLPNGPSTTDLHDPGSRKQRHTIQFGGISSWTASGIERAFYSPASKHKRMTSEVSGNKRLDIKDITNMSISEVTTRKAKDRAISKAPATTFEALSASTNKPLPPQSPTSAIPDVGVREKSGEARSFERELIEALRLDDVDSASPKFANYELSSTSPFRPDCSAKGERDSIQNPGMFAGSAIRSIKDSQNSQARDGANVEPSALRNLDRHEPLAESHLLHGHFSQPRDPRLLYFNDEASQRSYEHSFNGVDRLSLSRGPGYASNTTLPGSSSQVSDVAVAVASKAVRADQIRMVGNGLPKVAGEKTEFTADAHGKEGMEGMEVMESGPSGNPNSQYRQPSVSPLATPETSPLPASQQPQLGYRLAQQDYSKVSLLSEHADPSFIGNRATDSPLRPVSDLSSSEYNQPNHLRNGASDFANKNRSFGSLSHLAGTFRNLNSVEATPTAPWNNTSTFATGVSEQHQTLKGQFAVGKLKNIGRLPRISLGAADGGRKNAMNRLSELFGRTGTFEQNKSEDPPSFESFGGRLCFSATENPNFGSRYGVHETAADSSRRPSLPLQSPTPSTSQNPRAKFYAAGTDPQSRNWKPLPPNPGELSSDPVRSTRMSPSQPARGDGKPRYSIKTGNPEAADRKSAMERISTASKPLPLTPVNVGTPLEERSSPRFPDPANTNRSPGQGRVAERQHPVELPVRRDSSSEEFVMTPTAYPGQEWRPAGFGRG